MSKSNYGLETLGSELTFNGLIESIQKIHTHFSSQANRAVNVSLTLRNWGIGLYICEFEQNGADRATYGEALLDKLAAKLCFSGMKRVDIRELRRYRLFYITYPQIRETLSPESMILLPDLDTASSIRDSLSPELKTDGNTLLESLSFSHFSELIRVDDSLKRLFYETECIRGIWAVRELRRQISSLYYERSGLSENKEKLARMVLANVEHTPVEIVVRDPFIFEFLGLKSSEVMSEFEHKIDPSPAIIRVSPSQG